MIAAAVLLELNASEGERRLLLLSPATEIKNDDVEDDATNFIDGSAFACWTNVVESCQEETTEEGGW